MRALHLIKILISVKYMLHYHSNITDSFSRKRFIFLVGVSRCKSVKCIQDSRGESDLVSSRLVIQKRQYVHCF